MNEQEEKVTMIFMTSLPGIVASLQLTPAEYELLTYELDDPHHPEQYITVYNSGRTYMLNKDHIVMYSLMVNDQ